jgi:hypothetical protein
MKLKMALASIALACAAIALIASCSSFPKGKIILDLANSETPVMLNSIDKATIKGKTLSYEAGYKKRSVTASASSGGNTVTVTNTMASDYNQPLGMQMQGLLINDPAWIGTEGIAFSVDISDMIFIKTEDYILHVDAFVPVTKK